MFGAFLQAIRENKDLQLKLRGVTTAAIGNFDNLCWDGGELLWAAKTRGQAD